MMFDDVKKVILTRFGIFQIGLVSLAGLGKVQNWNHLQELLG